MDAMPEKVKQRSPTLEEIFQPWELEGRSRRDCISHRAGMLVPLATISLYAAAFSLLCLPVGGLFGLFLSAFGSFNMGLKLGLLPLLIPVLGIPLSLLTKSMARRDLDLIFAGEMDHRGYQQTEKARSDSHAAVMLHLLVLVCWLVLAGCVFLLCLAYSQ